MESQSSSLVMTNFFNILLICYGVLLREQASCNQFYIMAFYEQINCWGFFNTD